MSLPLTTFVEWNNFRFLIMDAPNDHNVHLYLKEMRQVGCTQCVRVCESTYEVTSMVAAGITVHDLPFTDGRSPPDEVLQKWLDIVENNMDSASKNTSKKNASEEKEGTIAIHCIAGLGRAPMMVAIAFIENGLEWTKAVEVIRARRRHAINAKQLEYLKNYKPTRASGCSCVIV
eukprot:GSMAST32.ASY1.ANO1.2779.1 assembled CDS